MRAEITGGDNDCIVTPFAVQDSSMLSVLARSGGLIIRPPHAPAAEIGNEVDVLLLR